MKLKKYIVWGLALMLNASFLIFNTSCDDFFETDPDNIVNNEDYMGQESEMYRGFLGLITKMQEVGDQAIYLTDPRCDYLETTGNAPVALQNINNYEDTDGNEYADPTGYYNIVGSCNDFIYKMDEYYKSMNGAMSDSAKVHYPKLISSALRIKVWAYYMLGRLYGEAYWYDKNITEVSNLDNTDVFTHMNMKELCDKCIDVLDNGIEVSGMKVPANLIMDWTMWADPINGNSDYTYWKYMTPSWMMLRFDLASWRTNYEDEATARADWRYIRESILDYYYKTANDFYYCNQVTTFYYHEMFWSEQVADSKQIISAVFYDYQNKQRNRLVQYLCPEYPGDGYYLYPSDYAMSKYSEADIRSEQQHLTISIFGGKRCLSKYYYDRYNNRGYLRSNIFEIQPAVVLFRGHDLHFLLAEAENHLGHWDVARSLLNDGLGNRFPSGALPDSVEYDEYGDPIWHPEYSCWCAPRGGYGNIGIAGSARAENYDLKAPEAYESEAARIKVYDLALADEYLKEFTGEGKSYPYLVKMADRYKDWTVVYDRVKGKYAADKQAKVRSSLETKYFINWNLQH